MQTNRILIIILSLILIFSIFSFSVLAKSKESIVSPFYFPTDASMSFWNIQQTYSISQVENGENFIVRLDLDGGSGIYDIYIDFGDGHSLNEKSFTGSIFTTSYHYTNIGTKRVTATVRSLGDPVYLSKNISVVEPQ